MKEHRILDWNIMKDEKVGSTHFTSLTLGIVELTTMHNNGVLLTKVRSSSVPKLDALMINKWDRDETVKGFLGLN